MDTYLEYLKDAYNRIVQLSLKDESLNVLSQMENKNFYFSRVHELFVELYSAQRQNKIKMLLEELETLKIKAASQKSIYSPTKQPPTQFVCQKCLINSRINEPSSQLRHQIQSTSKQNLHRTIKQNQLLSQQLKHINQSHIEQIKVLSTINQQTQNKLSSKIENLTYNLEQIQKRYKQLRGKYQNQTKAVEDLRRQLLEQRELNIRANGKIKELERDGRANDELCGRLREEISGLKQAKDMLEDKISRLEDLKTHHKNKLQIYQKQFKNISTQQQNSPAKIEYFKIGEEDHEQQDLNSLISTLTAKQLQIKRLTVDKFSLTQQNTTLRRQLTDYKSTTQKSISELKQNFNRIKLDYQKQLRVYRENQKNSLIVVKKLEMDSRMIKIEDYKQKVKSLEIEKHKLQNKVIKIQHSNQILLQNYEQITQAFRQQKQIFDKKLEQYEQSVENYHKLQKQLMKRNQIKENQCKQLQNELREKIRYYDEKIAYFEDELEQSKKNEEKLLRKNENYENEIKSNMLNQNSQKLVRRQHELVMKISQLQNIVEETRNTSKQLLDRKQQKLRSIKKELEEKCEKIIEYEVELEKETIEKENCKKNQKQTELLLRKQQQKIVQIQQKSRNQILEMMKNFDIKTKQLTEQLTKHYSSTSTYKTSLHQKSSSFSQNIKQIQQQCRLKLRAIQAQSSAIKSKNIILQDKLKQSQYKLRTSQQDLIKYEEQVNKLKNRENSLQNMYQQQKNKELQIVKHYQEKIGNFKSIFRQFKYEICQQFLSVTSSIKNQLAEIKKEYTKNSESYHKEINTNKLELEQKITLYQSTTNRKYQQQNARAYEEKMIRYERQKQQIVNHYENKLKEKSMDMMTISAEKEFVLEEIKQNQSILNKKYKELEGMYNKLVSKLEKNQKIQIELKEIIMKMESKVNDAERNSMIKQKQVYQLEKIIEELNEKLEKTEKLYKIQIKQCREKYRQENEKIFNKYERQFNKIITLNSKKNKDRPSLTSIMSARGISIPTKGNNDEDKIEKLKRQIQEQKKIVQEMESMKKN